jgi:hypothetical protein
MDQSPLAGLGAALDQVVPAPSGDGGGGGGTPAHKPSPHLSPQQFSDVLGPGEAAAGGAEGGAAGGAAAGGAAAVVEEVAPFLAL